MKTAREIAEKHLGRYPDQNNKPTWDQIRDELANDIRDYAVNVVLSSLDDGAIKGSGGTIVTP